MDTGGTTRPCPSCDGLMRRGERERTVTYRDESLTYLQPGWHCDACDDGILEGEEGAVSNAVSVMASWSLTIVCAMPFSQSMLTEAATP